MDIWLILVISFVPTQPVSRDRWYWKRFIGNIKIVLSCWCYFSLIWPTLPIEICILSFYMKEKRSTWFKRFSTVSLLRPADYSLCPQKLTLLHMSRYSTIIKGSVFCGRSLLQLFNFTWFFEQIWFKPTS